MRTSIRASTRGRANKVTKPKQRSGRTSSVPHEAVNQLSLAVAAGQHHYSHQDQENTDLDAPHDNGNAHENIHHQPSPDESQHEQLAVHEGFVTHGPGGDPSIHPALQALGAVTHGDYTTSLDHQAMDPHIQQTAAAAAAASDAPPRTAEQMVRQSGYDKVDLDNAASALSKRLMTQPGRRLAKQRRAEQNLNLVRRSNVEALLAHVSGQQAASACKNCHKGHGPWTECVVVDGQMCGSCANCWYNASGARCSFHETNNPQAHQPAILPAAAQSANSSFGLPALAPAGVQARPPRPITPPQIPLDCGPGRIIAMQAMAEVANAPSRAELLRLQIEVHARQLMLNIVELNRLQQAEPAQGGGHGVIGAQNMSMSGGSGQPVPDAAMEEAPGEDDGT